MHLKFLFGTVWSQPPTKNQRTTDMKIVAAFILMIVACASVHTSYASDPIKISDSDINKILKAKEIVRGMVNYPDTLVFHEFATKVNGNTVTLKFTAKNAYGVSETHTKDIKVD